MTAAVYLGIDVSKTELHLATPERYLRCFANSPKGRANLVRFAKTLKPSLVVLEASGGYERGASEAFQNAGLPISVSQPGCVKHFAKSLKVLAKTDKIDAQVIARFGEAIRPPVTPKTPENVKKIRALCDRRHQLVEDRVRESGRLEACTDKRVAAQIRSSIKRLKAQEETLAQQIRRLQENDHELQEKATLLTNQKGIGEVTAATLLAYLPELGTLNRQQAASLAGLAPYAQESGKWKGKRRIFGGRAAVRTALYMAAKSAARYCPVISQFYKRLKEAGKPYKVAIIACARKMLVRLNTAMKTHKQQSIVAQPSTDTT